MTASPRMPGHYLPEKLQRVLLLSIGIAAGWLAPYQLFTRTRTFFENDTLFDFVILAAAVLAGFVVLMKFKGKSPFILLVSAVGMTIIAFLSILQAPATDFANQSIPLVEFLGIPTQPMATNYSLVVLFALLMTGAIFHMITGLEDHGKYFIVAIVFGILVDALIQLAFPGSGAVFAVLGICSSVVILLLGADYPRWISPGTTNATTRGTVNRTSHAIIFSVIMMWLTFSLFTMGSMLVFFGTVRDPRESLNTTLLLSNLITGSLILLSSLFGTSRKPRINTYIAVPVAGTTIAIMYYLSCIGLLSMVHAIILGIPLTFITWYFVSEMQSIGFRGLAGVLMLVSWFLGAYIAFIPVKPGEIATYSSWFYYALIGLTVLEMVNLAWRRRLVNAMALAKKGINPAETITEAK
nr:hypothetical protein [Candidatus Sigynarchaeota archaeon]